MALGEPVQGLFRIVQSYLDLILCLFNRGKQVVRLRLTPGIVLVCPLDVEKEKERWRQRRWRIIHFTISALRDFGRNSVRCCDFGWTNIWVEILIRDLEYRRRHGSKPGDFFWSSTSKCESPTVTWVENRTIQHPCYPWYAAQMLWRTKVNILLNLFIIQLRTWPRTLCVSSTSLFRGCRKVELNVHWTTVLEA